MRRTSLLGALLVAGLVSSVPSAEAKKDLTKITCEEFLGLSEDVQPRAVAWLDGYSKAGKLKEEDIGEVDVDRRLVAANRAAYERIRGRGRDALPGQRPAHVGCRLARAPRASQRSG